MTRREFFEAIDSAVELIWKARRTGVEALIVHHDEADGICSAAITLKALEDTGFEVKPVCLEKLYPETVEEIYRESCFNLIVFTDIGGAHASLISEVNKSRIPTLILDHHKPEKPSTPSVFNLSPDLYGLNGDEISASTVAYMFAKKVSDEVKKLAHLALIGSAEIPGSISGLNLEATWDALTQGLVEPSGRNDFKVKAMGKPLSYRRLSSILSVLGSVGYYRGGPSIGLKVCLEGLTPEAEEAALRFEEERKIANRRLLWKLRREGLRIERYTQWFHSRDNYKGMGVKVIGSFCSYLRYQRSIVKPNLYLLGFMYMPREIPGFKPLRGDYTKVSGRLPKPLEEEVKKGDKPALSEVLPEACRRHGGFGDGHAAAASGVILRGEERGFIRDFDVIVESML